jgi:hypothetical protein
MIDKVFLLVKMLPDADSKSHAIKKNRSNHYRFHFFMDFISFCLVCVCNVFIQMIASNFLSLAWIFNWQPVDLLRRFEKSLISYSVFYSSRKLHVFVARQKCLRCVMNIALCIICAMSSVKKYFILVEWLTGTLLLTGVLIN